MKKMIGLMIFVTAVLVSTSFSHCEAKDVWVAHWDSENLDIYAMDETITGKNFDNGSYFKVSTKRLRNGELVDIVHWSFSKIYSDMWRYETSTMDGTHTTVVIAENKLFEFCMDELGWEYRVERSYYY